MAPKCPYGYPDLAGDDITDNFCELCSRRIKRRLEEWKTKKEEDKVNDINWVTPIKDPIQGYIKLTPAAQILLDTCYMQRLRRVLHLSFVYFAYPSAMHTRFEHSLGVYKIVTKILNNQYLKSKVDEQDKFKVQIAGLLHDVGHGPLSHLADAMAQILPHDIEVTHEAFSHWLINPSYVSNENQLKYGDKKTCLAKIIYDILEVKFQDITPNDRRDIRYNISYMIDLTDRLEDPKGLRHLINHNALDADKLDYLTRDAYETGSSLTEGIDLERLCDSIDINDTEGIIIGKNVAGSCLQLSYTRSLALIELYYHKVNRIASEMLLKAFQKAYNNTEKKSILEDKFIETHESYETPLFYGWDDFQFLYELLQMEGIPEFKKTVLKVLNRYFYKVIYGVQFKNENGGQDWEKDASLRRNFEQFLLERHSNEENTLDFLIFSFQSPSLKYRICLNNIKVRTGESTNKSIGELVPYKIENSPDYLLYICKKEEDRILNNDNFSDNIKEYLIENGANEESIKFLIT
ncbi:MAG: HD domain-containing protein [Atribacterota bacterium]